MTPPRLLHSTHNPFERDLLGSAASDRAPEATRARVRQSVARALASATAHGAAVDEDWPAAGNEGGSAHLRRGTSGGALRASSSLGLLALAAGVALLIRNGAREPALVAKGPSAPAPQALSRHEPSPSSALRALATADRSSAEQAQRSLANTNSGTAPLQHAAAPAPSGEEDAPDWLGAQLQLLGEARRQLEGGSLEQAWGLLDSYARRFPDGVLGPQIAALRAELRERQAARTPRRNDTQLNLPRR